MTRTLKYEDIFDGSNFAPNIFTIDKFDAASSNRNRKYYDVALS